MKDSLKTGFGFGSTSGVITTLGLIVGLDAGTHSKVAIIGGVLTIAIADALSDALGIHVSEESKVNSKESEVKQTTKEIWVSTLSTFIAKFIFAITFLIPILLLPFTTAIIVSVIWDISILGISSYCVARAEEVKPWGVIAEHLFLALTVIVATYYVGNWVGATFEEP